MHDIEVYNILRRKHSLHEHYWYKNEGTVEAYVTIVTNNVQFEELW